MGRHSFIARTIRDISGVQFSIEGRDLARAVNQAQDAVRKSVVWPVGYTLDWGGEFSEYVEAREQFAVIGPLAIC